LPVYDVVNRVGLASDKTLRMFGSKQRDMARDLYPDSPWMWREEWAKGRVRCSSKKTVILAWIFALFWSAVSLPLLWAIPREFGQGNTAALIGLLFPVVGVGLLVWATRATLHWRRFGTSEFAMDTFPGVTGGELRGSIHTREGVSPLEGFRVKLICVNRVTTGSGKSRSTREHIRWQEEQTIGAGYVRSLPYRTEIPVAFRIPYESEPSSAESSDNEIVWRLEVAAAVRGVDFHSRFEVPVFKTDDSGPELSREPEVQERLPDLTEVEAGSGIRVVPGPTGGQEFVFPPARNPRVAVTLTLFGVAWSGVVAALVYAGEPFFAAIFGFFDALILFAIVALWLQNTRVFVQYGSIEIRERILGLGRTVAIQAGEVDDLRPEIQMQAGSTPYYDIQITRRDGSTVIAGRWIRSKRDAEAVALALKSALGPTL
jgi:hypothetical protein